ncbi:hypothetical protein ABFS82_06G140200 [Erythranthe guttata]|uniref:uncharacterized protein LOC105969867 n=1 Tax=Erythranthe guttata TaxID=4155 RepID=UPI00064E0664|nr:PREDICTED: uncharacterized protein LOC105969867 [Erythranthe guttata]|eukprot:XP_012850095.1 PREDICTED: uncharacterized protein LOC105969867 [Erythranthe guttata]
MGKREIGTEIGERDGDYDSDDDMGGGTLYYDRDNPGSGEPNGLQYFQSMVNLAIDFYNKDKAEKEKYSVVELIKLFGVAGAGDYLSLDFTAKLEDSDPIPFYASILDGIHGIDIEYVGTDAQSAI